MSDKIEHSHPFYDIHGPIAIAHRGGDAAGPEEENSLAAFDSAHQAGYVYGETDTIATADNKALAFHGSKNERKARKTGLPTRKQLQSMTYQEIADSVRIGGEPVPLLEELLVTFPDMRFFIDAKTDEAVRPLTELVNKLNVKDRVSLGSFKPDRVRAVRELLGGQPDVCTNLIGYGDLALKAAGLVPFQEALGVDGIHLKHYFGTKNIIERAHERGIHVLLWTPKSERAIERGLVNGAHGVIADRTELLKQVVLEHDPNNPSIRSR